MGTPNGIPRTEAEFNNYVNIAIPYINTNKARLATTPAATTALTTVTALLTTAGTGWNSIYPQSLNPATSTASIRATKNSLHDQIKGYLRVIFDDIPKSVFTQVDRDTLNLPLPSDTRTPSAIPAERPIISVTQRDHLAVTLAMVDAAHPQSLAKPADADAIELEGAFLPAGSSVPASFPQDSDFRHLTTTGRSTYTRSYTQEQLRGTEYLRARYLNSRKEAGGWSEIITVIVS